jgi:membrane protease YdiL (CAAX protease family)
MNTNAALIERLSLPIFLVVTPLFGVAIPLVLPVPPVAYVTLAALVPALMAILLMAATGGRKGVAALLRKLTHWQISLAWYAVALGLPLVMLLAVGGLAFLLGWIPAIQLRPVSPTHFLIGALILVWAVLEELGWRGFALPRLLAHRTGITSALVIGMAWGVFHLGLGAAEGRPLLPTFLVPFGASVVFTWLYVQSRGSLVTVVLFHTGLNIFPMFMDGISIAQSLWLQASVNLALALVLTLLFGAGLQRAAVKPAALAETG